MVDYDWQLRRLLRGRKPSVSDGSSPRIVVVSGGRIGVGVTTLAVNLAISFTAHGHRTILVDADLTHAKAASFCGLTPPAGLADVLTGRRDIHEVMQLGPGGVQIVAGSNTNETREACHERAIQRLVRQIQGLGRFADVVILDTPAEPSPLVRQIWQMADEVLLVTTPDAVAVMDTYALVKTLGLNQAEAVAPRLIVNRVADAATAADVHRRIDQSCQRFLNVSVMLAKALPDNAGAELAAINGAPLMIAASESTLSVTIDQLTQEMTAVKSANRTSTKAA